MMLMMMNARATTSTTPWTSIGWLPLMPSNIAVPMPGRAKMTSMTIAPPIR